MKAYRRNGGEWSVSPPFTPTAALSPRETAPGNHWIGGWVGPRAGLDAVVRIKIPSPLPGPEPLIIQSVAQRYATELGFFPGGKAAGV
jgi:hypothetical protein